MTICPKAQRATTIGGQCPQALGGIFPGNAFYDGQRAGQATIPTGVSRASYLELPVVRT